MVTQERRLWKIENSSDFREDAKVLGEPHSGIGIILLVIGGKSCHTLTLQREKELGQV